MGCGLVLGLSCVVVHHSHRVRCQFGHLGVVHASHLLYPQSRNNPMMNSRLTFRARWHLSTVRLSVVRSLVGCQPSPTGEPSKTCRANDMMLSGKVCYKFLAEWSFEDSNYFLKK